MPNSTDARGWLNSRRLRTHGLILALCLWGLYGWNMATPGLRDRAGNLKGTDFLHLYTLGSLALEYRGADLYNMNAQAALAAQRIPDASGIRYLPLYPPQVSIFFAPLARLSYARALISWLIFNTLIYGLCAFALWRCCTNLRGEGWCVFLLAIAFPPFFHLIAWGQTAGLALACFTVAFLALRSDRNILAGFALGCLIFKPQLGLAAAGIFLSMRAWKVLAGAIAAAAAELIAAWLFYGVAPLREWIHVLWRVPGSLLLLEPKPYQTHSLRTFWNMLIPWPQLSFGLYVLSAFLAIGLAIDIWRRASSPLALRYSSLLLATVLIAPHLTVYDLVILLPAFFLLVGWMVDQPTAAATRRLGDALYLVYLLPLLGPFDGWTHLQLSVIAMAGLLYLIWRLEKIMHIPREHPIGNTPSASTHRTGRLKLRGNGAPKPLRYAKLHRR
jgi:Glycosyltransferase family 87